jgi:hypothetical protein
MMKKLTPLEIILDVFIILATTFGIIMFAFVFVWGFKYWATVFASMAQSGLSERMFWLGVLIAIVASCMMFTEMFLNGLLDTLKRLGLTKWARKRK